MIQPFKSFEEAVARRARYQAYASWFGLFEACGITSPTLKLTRIEILAELDKLTRYIKKIEGRKQKHEQAYLHAHS